MSQKVNRYRAAMWDLLDDLPATDLCHSTELGHYSKNGKTYFNVDLALVMYGYNYQLTVAVDKITSKAEVVNEHGKDITELCRKVFHKEYKEFLEEDGDVIFD
mgnify:FL=1